MGGSKEGVHGIGCFSVGGIDIEMTYFVHKFSIRPPKSLSRLVKGVVKEAMFPNYPFRQFVGNLVYISNS